jgi:hypothetical protein
MSRRSRGDRRGAVLVQLGGVPPSGDEVRVGVLLAAAGAEEIVDQPADPLPARITDLPDHRSRLRICSAAASSRSARRMLSARRGEVRRNSARSRSASPPPD